MSRFLVLLFFILSVRFAYGFTAQDSNTAKNIIIGNIIISGNKKTKTSIIQREITFKVGDIISIKNLQEDLELSKNQIFNTTLFTEVKYLLAFSKDSSLTVIFTVKERWYIFPLPHFRLVDRNFNDWWVTHNRSLERVDYGLKFYHNNVSGNNDRFTGEFITGYSRQYSVRYNLPFFDKKLTKGIAIGISHVKQKEINYNTTYQNKPQLLPTYDGFPRTSTKIDLTLSNRPNLFLRHFYKLSFTWESIDKYVRFFNPNYYLDSVNELSFLELSYGISYIKTDYNIYPTKGINFAASLNARLFADANNTYSANAVLMYAKPISKKSYFRNRMGIQVKFPFNTGFSNQNLFGYGAFQIRGMEYYVVDGTLGLMNKATFGYNFTNFKLKVPIKNKHIDNIPFKVYARVFNDLGYGFSKNIITNLNDRLLHGYGFGIDFLTIYDIVFKFEYSFNNLNNSGLFFGIRD